MKEEELIRMVEHEIQWLNYYSTSESRSKLSIDSDLYSELQVMGYCKKPTPLYIRCSICLLSNGSEINTSTTVESLSVVHRVRGEFDYTPLEAFFRIYPEKREWVVGKLKPIEKEWKPFQMEIKSTRNR